MSEVRVSPDRSAVAIKSDFPQDALAYGVIHKDNGGHWASAESVADWAVLDVPAATEVAVNATVTPDQFSSPELESAQH